MGLWVQVELIGIGGRDAASARALDCVLPAPTGDVRRTMTVGAIFARRARRAVADARQARVRAAPLEKLKSRRNLSDMEFCLHAAFKKLELESRKC